MKAFSFFNQFPQGESSPLPTLALIGGAALVRNLLFPLYADDYAYSFLWEEAQGGNFRVGPGCTMRRVKTLRDVVSSQLSHYRVSGGRSVAHALDQLFLIHGKKLFNFANTGVTLAQLLLSGKMLTQEPDKRTLLWLAGCHWFCAPHSAASCQWMTGAFNYLWMGALQSAFVLPYCRRLDDPACRLSPVLMAPLGFLSGWSNEAGASAALLYGGFATLRALFCREKDLCWMMTGLLSGAAGLAVMLCAPGNYRRMELGDEFSPQALPQNPDRTAQRSYFTREMLLHHLKNGFLGSVLPQLPMHLPVLLYFTPLGRRSRDISEKILLSACVSLAVPCALLLSPEFPERAAYPSVLYGMAASAEALNRLSLKPLPKLDTALLGALALTLAASFGVDASLFIQARRRLRILKAHGLEDFVSLPRYRVPRLLRLLTGGRSMDNYSLQFDIDEDPNDCYNHLIAQYYGVRGIQAQPEKGGNRT